jgi:hypothetical protein
MTWSVSLPSIDQVVEEQKNHDPIGRGYMRRGGIIYYRGRVWVPENLRVQIMRSCHEMPPFYHPGQKKTKAIIMRVFCWPNIDADVCRYLKGCLTCQRIRPGVEKLQGLWHPHRVTPVFDKVYLDTWHCVYDGVERCVVTMIDYATRWVECYVCSCGSPNSSEVALAFLLTWCCRFGFPLVVVTDNGTEFKKHFERLCASVGIEQVRTATYHPEANARSKRSIDT